MYCRTISMVFLIIHTIYNVVTACSDDNISNKPHVEKFPSILNIHPFEEERTQNKNSEYENLIIFDLSKNVVSKEIFDISIKIFLNYILQYCNTFKYISIDDNFNGCKEVNGCNITINNCDRSNKCEEIIDLMDYNLTASSYSNSLSDTVDSKIFMKLMTEIFSKSSSVQENSVILLTNRIVSIQPDQEFIQKVLSSNIKLTSILLGKNETPARQMLEQEYKKIPNAKALNFKNPDCLNYLFYCILPCSSNKPECMKNDISDCQQQSKWTPNANLDETLHVWYVLDFFCDNPWDFLKIRDNIVIGLKNYVQTSNFQQVRIRLKYGTTGWWNTAFEDIDSISSIIYVICYTEHGDVVIDDNNSLNKYLLDVPWSGTLTKTRTGALAVIVLTNYATTSFITERGSESFYGQMFIYNSNSFDYYSAILKNDTNFHIYSMGFENVVSVNPLIPKDPITLNVSTSSVKTFSTTSMLATTIKHSFNNISATTTLSSSQQNSSNSTGKIIIPVVAVGILFISLVIVFIIYRKTRRATRQRNNAHFKRSKKRNDGTVVGDGWELTWDRLAVKSDELHTGLYEQLLHGKFLNGTQTGIYHEDIDVAIKMPNKNASKATKSNFLMEINLMKLINGQNNIVKMFGCITTGDRNCLVLEFCLNLDLFTFIRSLKYTRKELEENQKVVRKEFFIFAWQISHGLQYLASQEIIHRNLTAKNILVDSEKNAKITDFGLAIHISRKDQIISSEEKRKFETKWLAIESLKNNIFSFSSDIWAFGIILFEMYSFGETPYAFMETESEILKYLENGKRLEKPNFCSDEIFEIMSKCWFENPFKRPKYSELIRSFSQLLEYTTEGYGYLKVLQPVVSTSSNNSKKRFSTLENVS